MLTRTTKSSPSCFSYMLLPYCWMWSTVRFDIVCMTSILSTMRRVLWFLKVENVHILMSFFRIFCKLSETHDGLATGDFMGWQEGNWNQPPCPATNIYNDHDQSQSIKSSHIVDRKGIQNKYEQNNWTICKSRRQETAIDCLIRRIYLVFLITCSLLTCFCFFFFNAL